MTKRNPLSRSRRFEVFKRDGFRCQYCGNAPPSVILEIDHIVAVSRGGVSDTDNLVTCCFDCNRGKAARSLSSVPQSLKDKAAEVAEREAQLQEYQKILAARRERLEQETWDVAEIWVERFGEDGIRKDYFQSIKRFIEKLGLDDVLEAMEIAVNRKWSANSAFKYFCGICWAKVRESEDGQVA